MMDLHPWTLTDSSRATSGHVRTLFALSNGFLGIRGAHEEEEASDQVFVNGFYETWPITYPEDAYGLARVGQTLQPAPNPCRFSLVVDGHDLVLDQAEVQRSLDLKTGILSRKLTWETPDGIEVRLTSDRLVSATQPGCAVMTYSVEVSRAARVRVTSWLECPLQSTDCEKLDPRRGKSLVGALKLTHLLAREDSLEMVVRAQNSGTGVGCVLTHFLDGDAEITSVSTPTSLGRQYTAQVGPGRPFALTVVASFATDGPFLTDQAQGVDESTLVAWARKSVDSPAKIRSTHITALEDWWAAGDVEVGTDDETQGAIRWNLFQGFQATACVEQTGVPAKGLTGSGYDGHTFWDLEGSVYPMLTYTQPGLVRRCLGYRYRILDRARARAQELHHAGAMYPWRTIDGREASAFFEAGTAQYHINADIAYAINRYLEATQDWGYLIAEGLEILIETSRLWMSVGFLGRDGQFHIHGVTGPDEYSALVDDNLYTNVMAKTHLEVTAQWLARLADHDMDAWTRITQRLNLDTREVESWISATQAMMIPFDEDMGIHAQDAGFLNHEVWDFMATPKENYPLLLHYHPLTIYRHQVLKQADVILALINRHDLFTEDHIRADFEYYDPITTGDSSLSASAQAIIAAQIGDHDLAYHYFKESLFTDLHDSHHNTGDGVHLAANASVWSTLVMGFAGFRDFGGYRLEPHLPQGWEYMRFRLRMGDSLVGVEITSTQMNLFLIDGPPVEVNETTVV